MYFLQGFILGLSYLAPIGMQNMFIINTALTQSTKRIWLTLLIIIMADFSLSLSAFFGVGLLLTQFPSLTLILLLVGGLLVTYMGWQLWHSSPTLSEINSNIPIVQLIRTAFLVTWANPQALIDSTMLLGGIRASLPVMESLTFFGGVLLATPTWFGGLTLFFRGLATKITPTTILWINRLCGLIIGFYGLHLLYTGLQIWLLK